MKNIQGFTMIEMLLSVSLLALIMAFSWPFFSTLHSNQLDITSEKTINVLRQAQTFARTAKYDLDWGVSILDDRAILFAGETYNKRVPAYDEVFLFESGITADAAKDIVFYKYSGEIKATEDVTISLFNNSKIIYVTTLGVISY